MFLKTNPCLLKTHTENCSFQKIYLGFASKEWEGRQGIVCGDTDGSRLDTIVEAE